MTFDLTSRLAVVAEPTESPNERTPAFDLDSVYGAGPLQLDRESYVSQRGWRPTLPQRNGRVTGDFKMVDLLTFAGVAPDQRGQ